MRMESNQEVELIAYLLHAVLFVLPASNDFMPVWNEC